MDLKNFDFGELYNISCIYTKMDHYKVKVYTLMFTRGLLYIEIYRWENSNLCLFEVKFSERVNGVIQPITLITSEKTFDSNKSWEDLNKRADKYYKDLMGKSLDELFSEWYNA